MVVIILAVILPFVFRFFVPRIEAPHFGIYARPGGILYHLKFYMFYFIIKLRRFKNYRTTNVQSGNAGYGQRSKSSIEEMDKAQPLPADEPKVVH